MAPNPTGRRLSLVAVLVSMSIGLLGCSSGTSPPSAPSPSRSSSAPAAGELVPALSRYGLSPCALLDEQELARFQITKAPRLLHLSFQPPSTACYWTSSTGIQFAFVTYPSAKARKRKASQPGTRRVTIDGFTAVQSIDEKSCYQNIALSPDDTFSSLVIRTKPSAPRDTCGLATDFTKLIFFRLQQLSHSSPTPG